jgi:hypothetical protein
VLPEFVVKRPFHWATIARTDENIFEELEKFSIGIDFSKFEEWFCEPYKAEESGQKPVKKEKTLLKDERRLFLVSIALKTLEKKKIDITNLEDVIYNDSFNSEYEDLLNIDKILPTDEDTSKFTGCDISELNPIEKFMCSFREKTDLKKILKILIYERKFIDESVNVEITLNDIKEAFIKISESNNLRIILKTILDLGNAINCKYLRGITKRKARGFKLSSLSMLHAYRGNRGAGTLLTFLLLTLLRDRPETFKIFEELRKVHKIKDEDMNELRARINKMITEYKDCIECMKLIQGDHGVCKQLRKFLAYAYVNLNQMGRKYREDFVYSGMLKAKLGENEKCPIKTVLNDLSDFLVNLEKEYKTQVI